MNLAGISGGELFGVLGIARGNDVVAVFGQNRMDYVANRLFILDEENGLRAALGEGSRLRDAGFLHGAVDTGQVDLKGAALAELAVHPDVAAALFDDAVNGRETQTGAASTFLCSVEGLEDVHDGPAIHAHTGVGNREHDVAAGLHADMVFGVARIEIGVSSLHNQAAAIGHGVAGVYHQIHDDLLDLCGVSLHFANVFRDVRDHLHVIVHQPAQQLIQIENDAIEVDGFWLQHLAPAEGEQLTHEACGAARGVFDAFDIRAKFWRNRGTAKRQFGVSGDDRQKVVEVMSDAAGEAPDRLHFTGLLELRFQLLAFRDVNDDAFHDRVGIAALHDHGGVVEPDLAAVLALDPEFRLKGCATFAGFFGSGNGRQIIRMNQLGPALGDAQPLFGRVAENGLHLRADVKPLSVNADFRDIGDGVDLLDEHLVFGFGFRVLRKVAADTGSATVGHGADVQFDGKIGAVSPVQQYLGRPFARLGQRAPHLRFKAVHILKGVDRAPGLPNDALRTCKAQHASE